MKAPAVSIDGVAGLLMVGAALYVVAVGPAEAVKRLSATLSSLFPVAVTGIGSGLGIPETDSEQCKLAKRAGDAWEASYRCPAADYIAWVAGGMQTGGASGSWSPASSGGGAGGGW